MNNQLKLSDVIGKNFQETLDNIKSHYQTIGSSFNNGEIKNSTSQNQGSAIIFSFSLLNNLTKEETLSLFGEHYEEVVSNKNNPEYDKHANIRQFMKTGFEGLNFPNGYALLE